MRQLEENMTEPYSVKIDETAFAEIDAVLCSLRQYSEQAAERLADAIMHTISSLDEFPFRYQELPIKKRPMLSLRRAVILNRYYLIYSVQEKTVVIERFIDAHRGFRRTLR